MRKKKKILLLPVLLKNKNNKNTTTTITIASFNVEASCHGDSRARRKKKSHFIANPKLPRLYCRFFSSFFLVSLTWYEEEEKNPPTASPAQRVALHTSAVSSTELNGVNDRTSRSVWRKLGQPWTRLLIRSHVYVCMA